MILKVTEGPSSGKILRVSQGNTYLIGRDEKTCQLVLQEPEVSRSHAKIFVDDNGDITISDNDSQNGTFINNFRISAPAYLSEGDKILAGSSVIEVYPDDQYSLDTDERSHQSAYRSFDPSLSANMIGSVITIGRDVSNNLVLDHPHVSRNHAVVEITEAGWFIRDLNSTNGTYVDGTKVVQKHPLYADSVIRISGYRLTLDDFKLVTHDETSGQIELVVRDLSKVVSLSNGEELVLLNNVNFKVQPREFVAILGGSGTGKSTLLKALMGTSPASYGEILINGTNYYEEYDSFKSMTGYVPQDDIIHLELTVEEVLQYAARLRMPDDTTAQERNKRVEEVMEILELTFRRSTPVKKLSGGQRKRVSIGVELITKPSMMFLDEPTSGLDPGLEKLMMRMMRNMANRGQTIFCVTHATFNIHLCDKIIFLTEGGRLAFFGSPREALDYFGTEDFAEIYRMINNDETPEEWHRRFDASELAVKYYPQGYANDAGAHSIRQTDTKTSSLLQLFTLISRYYKVMSRNKKNLLLLFIQPVIIAVGVGLMFIGGDLFVKSPYQPEELVISAEVIMEGRFTEVSERLDLEADKIQNLNAFLMITILTAIWFGAANSVTEIVKENPIYKRERAVNLCIFPYIMSKTIVLSLVCLAQSLLFVIILWAFLDLSNFWLFILSFFLIIVASSMMGLFVSSLVSTSTTGTSMLPLLLMPQIVLSGGLVPIDQIDSEAARLIFNLGISKWGYEVIGGRVIDVNYLIALEDKLSAFEGPFGAHWWWLVALSGLFYLGTTLAVMRKDKDLS